MLTKPLLLELLVSGFFAIACFRARAQTGDASSIALKPRDLLRLTDRLERLRQTRWQWCSMVLIVVAVRLQSGLPMVVELTAALQFIVFLALPAETKSRGVIAPKGRKTLRPSSSAQICNAKIGS